MRAISDERLGEYIKTAFDVLKDNGYECRSGKLIDGMKKRLIFNEYEKYRFKSDQDERWVTYFRFNTLGLVKGGYIKKQKRIWYLTHLGKQLMLLTPLEIVKANHDAYLKWLETRDTDDTLVSIPNVIESSEELSDMELTPAPLSFTKLIQGVEEQTIQIPPFQRNFVWSAKEIVDLLDSIYRGYPIGSFIFWKTNKKLPYTRIIGDINLKDSKRFGPIDYCLDGQQRITSLFAAVRGSKIEDEKIYFYFDIDLRRFDYERTDPESSKHASEINITRIPLEKLFVKTVEYFKYVGQFPEAYQERLNELYSRFNKYAFSIVYVQEEHNDENDDIKQIVKIFTKINETGRKLTVVAKMIARCWGENFDLRDKLDSFFITHDDNEAIREETILQIASVLLNDKRCKARIILLETSIDELDDQWENIIKALQLALDFLKKYLRIQNLKYLPFDSILVPLSYFFYFNHNPSNRQIEQLKVWFWKTCLSNRYGSTTEQKIEEDCYLFDKILNEEDVDFPYDIAWDSLKLRLIELEYNLRNALCKTVLTLYSYYSPKDFKTNGDINLNKNLSIFNKTNLHHFFPRNYLEKNNDFDKQRKDSIVNIAFCPFVVNSEASDAAPSVYIENFYKLNPDLPDTLKSHLIEDVNTFGITDNNYRQFLEKRAEQIENKFRILLGLKSKTEQQFETEPESLLNIFEIKMRQLINTILSNSFGEDYWNTAIPQELRISVMKKLEQQYKVHPYEKEKEINKQTLLSYLDVMDYYTIIESNWNLFEHIFGSKFVVQGHFHALKYYRNPIKHVRELNNVDQLNGEAAVLWFERVFKAQEQTL